MDSCKNCKHCIRQGIEYNPQGGLFLVQDYTCSNPNSETKGDMMSTITDKNSGFVSDDRTTLICNNWEGKFVIA